MFDFDNPQKTTIPTYLEISRPRTVRAGKGIHLLCPLPKKDTDTRTLCFVIGWVFLSMAFFVLYATN